MFCMTVLAVMMQMLLNKKEVFVYLEAHTVQVIKMLLENIVSKQFDDDDHNSTLPDM